MIETSVLHYTSGDLCLIYQIYDMLCFSTSAEVEPEHVIKYIE